MLVASSPENLVVRSVLLCSFLLCLSAVGNAAEVHKCATPTGISYQGLPCEGPELPTPAVVANATSAPTANSARTTDGVATAGQASPASVAPAMPDCDTKPRLARRPPWGHATICIGMTDDEVLNLPGWGRPAKIVRTRVPREWREEWFYDARAAGPRQLFFVNGKLALIETELAESAVGSRTSLASN